MGVILRFLVLWLIVIPILYFYLFHLINTIQSNNRFGWGTVFIFKKYVSKIYFEYDYMVFRLNGILLLLDPVSFGLILLFLLFKKLIERMRLLPSDLFKTYTKVESEKILDKITK